MRQRMDVTGSWLPFKVDYAKDSRQSTLMQSFGQVCWNSEQAVNGQSRHTVHNCQKCVNTDSWSDLLIMVL